MPNIKKLIISETDSKLRYDKAAKYLLSDVRILARILHSFVPEFMECDIKDIEDRYIEKSSVSVSRTGVADISGQYDPALMPGEDPGFNEADIFYDIVFRAVYPDSDGGEIGLYINIEAQNDIYPGYPLEMRAVYYCARLLCSQLKTVSRETNYGGLKKACSIWLCFDSPMKDAGEASLYRLDKHDIMMLRNKSAETGIIEGLPCEETDPCYYDLISIIIIKLNKSCRMTDKTMEFLRVLFSDDTDPYEKITAVRKSGIDLDEHIRKGIGNMCNLSEGIWQRGLKEGIEKGEERLNSLNICLMDEGKFDEMKLAMHDKSYRQILYKRYGL